MIIHVDKQDTLRVLPECVLCMLVCVCGILCTHHSILARSKYTCRSRCLSDVCMRWQYFAFLREEKKRKIATKREDYM